MSIIDRYDINYRLIDILNNQQDLLISTKRFIYKDLPILRIVLNYNQ